MTKKSKKLKELSEADLSKKIAELREKIRTDKFQTEGGKTKNVKAVKEVKRDIARMLTILNTNIKT